MHLVNQTKDENYVIEFTSSELRLLASLGLEIMHGSLNIKEDEWNSALLPAPKSDAIVVFQQFHNILNDQIK